MTFKPLAPALAIALFAPIAAAEPVPYVFDKAHTNILFEVRHMGLSWFIGQFGDFEGTLLFDPEDPAASSVEVTIPVASVDTDVDKLDQHLVRDDFFNAAEFPEMRFASTNVRVLGEGRLAVDGELTLLGVTRPLTLDVTVSGIGPHPMHKRASAGFSATGTLDRTDFGMDTYAPDVVGPEVRIRIEAETSVPKG